MEDVATNKEKSVEEEKKNDEEENVVIVREVRKRDKLEEKEGKSGLRGRRRTCKLVVSAQDHLS